MKTLGKAPFGRIRKWGIRRIFSFAFSVSSFLWLTACGSDGTAAPASQCTSGASLIGVYDGKMVVHCGCGVAAGTEFGYGAPLTCTINTGEMLVFQYISTVHAHQISSVGAPSFQTSGVHHPSSDLYHPVHAIVFDTPGNYSFVDSFFSTQTTGTITVL